MLTLCQKLIKIFVFIGMLSGATMAFSDSGCQCTCTYTDNSSTTVPNTTSTAGKSFPKLCEDDCDVMSGNPLTQAMLICPAT